VADSGAGAKKALGGGHEGQRVKAGAARASNILHPAPGMICLGTTFLLEKRMSTMEVTSVSAKGQVVIPGAIRATLGIRRGTRLAVITDGENVLMKPLESPKLEAFQRLIAESRAYARRAGLKPADVSKAIRKARNAGRARR